MYYQDNFQKVCVWYTDISTEINEIMETAFWDKKLALVIVIRITCPCCELSLSKQAGVRPCLVLSSHWSASNCDRLVGRAKLSASVVPAHARSGKAPTRDCAVITQEIGNVVNGIPMNEWQPRPTWSWNRKKIVLCFYFKIFHISHRSRLIVYCTDHTNVFCVIGSQRVWPCTFLIGVGSHV